MSDAEREMLIYKLKNKYMKKLLTFQKVYDTLIKVVQTMPKTVGAKVRKNCGVSIPPTEEKSLQY